MQKTILESVSVFNKATVEEKSFIFHQNMKKSGQIKKSSKKDLTNENKRAII